MSTFISSTFFDSEDSTHLLTIWDPFTSKDDPLLKETFIQYISKSQQKVITLSASLNYLYLINSIDTTIRGQLYLIFSKFLVVHQAQTEDRLHLKNHYGFIISSKGQILELYTLKKDIFEQWKSHFEKRCIRVDFHDENEVIKQIGIGTFANVYLVYNKNLESNFAVKAFSKQKLKDSLNGKDGLMNEIKILRNLENQHLMKLNFVFESNNSIYLVMEVLEGGEILSRFENKEYISSNNLQLIMFNLLKGVAYMHRKGYMHRDIKPQNILFRSQDDNYDVVLCDFGLATEIKEKRKVFSKCGTPGFVAPEVLTYDPRQQIYYTEACDVFSLGIVFYVLSTGIHPFSGQDYYDILRMNMKCEIDFQIKELTQLPADFQSLLTRMLERNPMNRITIEDCLKHKYFELLHQNISFETQKNLTSYRNKYLSPLQKRNKPSLIDSFGLVESQQIMKGITISMESISGEEVSSIENDNLSEQKAMVLNQISQDQRKKTEDNQFLLRQGQQEKEIISQRQIVLEMDLDLDNLNDVTKLDQQMYHLNSHSSKIILLK